MVKRLIMVAAALSALSLSSCTDGDKGTSTAQGNTFYFNLSAEPKTLNPVTYNDTYAQTVHEYVMDTLLVRNPDTYEFMPALAESYEVSKDGLQFTFKIRKDVKFHDGAPLTAEDVKASYDAIFNDAYGAFRLRPYYEVIKEIKIIDPLTITFVAKEKIFNTLESLGVNLAILPKHIYSDAAKGKDINRELIGSGPYKLTKYETGKRIVLEKNPDWWGYKVEAFKGKFAFDKIVMKFIKESAVALQMLKKGELDYEVVRAEDFMKNMEGQEWSHLTKVAAENKFPKSTGFIGWNLKRDMFKERDVRVALAHLMNRDEMNKKFRFNKSLLATGPWYQQNDYADPDVKPFLYEPENAAKLLKSSGWSDSDKDGILDKIINGKKVNFEFTLLNPSKDVEKYFVLYQADLKKAGIKMNIQLLEWNSFIQKVDEQNFDAIAMAWTGDVEYDAKQIWHSDSAVKGGSNFISYKNPEVDKAIDAARRELDRDKRIALTRKVYRLIANDAPYAVLFNEKFNFYAHTPRIKKPKDTFTYEVGVKYWSVDPAQLKD